MTTANTIANIRLQAMAKNAPNGYSADFEMAYPFIFIGNYFVNGFEDLLELDTSGKLDAMLFKVYERESQRKNA